MHKKAKSELHKYVTCCFKQILEVTSQKTAAAQPLTSNLANHPSKTNQYAEYNGEARNIS